MPFKSLKELKPLKLPKYKYLLTYRYAEMVYDLTVAFVKRYLDRNSRTIDQMIQAARSTKQNIIEAVSELASLKGQIKLLGVAYASIEELTADYEDFLRQRQLIIYPKNHQKTTAFRQLGFRLSHLSNLSNLGYLREKPSLSGNPQDDANLLLTFCHQLSFLLSRQVKKAEEKFIQQGGYSENLFQKRIKSLKQLKSLKIGFTIMEILIVVSLLAIIAVAAFTLLNPVQQIRKAWDSKRKNELSQLRKVLEDWYNDKNCYPKPSEICYDPSTTPLSDGTYTCHICGKSLSPYLAKLPCDPQHPKKQYLYQTNSLSCPNFYRIYTRLSIGTDPEIKVVGCYPFCGPVNEPISYNYVVTSPNTKPENNISGQLYYCSGINNCTSIVQDRLPNEIKICNPSYTSPNCDNSGCPAISTCYYQPL
jgi:four helix bundle suffix protein